MESHAAFLGVLYDDARNTALRQVLSTHLSVCELCALVQVCTAFRSWLVGHGAQLFLGVTALDIVGGKKVLREWQPHFLLNGQPTMCKKRTILITPRVYSCYGRAADGRQLVHEVPPGKKVDTERSAVTLRLVHASTRAEAEVLLRNLPLFVKKQTPKGTEKDYSNTHHMGIHIRETLSRHQTPPGRYRVQVELHLVHGDTKRKLNVYVYTSDAFYVVAAPPKRGSETERARREEPHRRSSIV